MMNYYACVRRLAGAGLLSGLLLTGGGSAAYAQVVPANAPAAPAPAASHKPGYTLIDSLDAVQAMFVRKRSAGRLPLVLALPALRLMGSTRREYNVYTGAWEDTPAPPMAVAAGLLLAGAGTATMLVTNSVYSRDKLADMRRENAIPAEYRQMLRPRHFARAAKWRAKAERKAARRNGY